ncbi:DUF1003 domain-containing protein [Lactovum miscens]|uniref:Putative membrane protein n=1 Tax=Lactovum miscens TaxID=190387 RepID=A0A841C7D4_9LACT|nr:DUF1003 domain-containing protein [Lactovum miscens]MBB5888703.1 putative membrane protein [Lactovum miscens]
MEKTYKDVVSGKDFPLTEGMFIGDLDKSLVALIRRDVRHVRASDFISQHSLMNYRLRKINDMINSDKKVNKRMRDRFTKVLNDKYYHEIDVQKELDETNTFGQKVADAISKFGGSWSFILPFGTFLIIYVLINTFKPFGIQWDKPYFILLNLVLSMLAALQAPLIMMSQNRAAEYDRMESQNDYRVNQKTEVEIRLLHSKIDHIIQQDQPNGLEIQKLQTEMIQSLSQQILSLREELKDQDRIK